MKIFMTTSIISVGEKPQIDNFIIDELDIAEEDFEPGFIHKEITVVSKMFKTRRDAFNSIVEQLSHHARGNFRDGISENCKISLKELELEYLEKYPEVMI